MSAPDPALVAAVQKVFDNLLCSACQRHGLTIPIRDCLPHIGTHRADFAILVSAWLGPARAGLRGAMRASDELMTEFVSKKQAANWGVINDGLVAAATALAALPGKEEE